MASCTSVSVALLRYALTKYEEVIAPLVKSWARLKWGEKQDSHHALPCWLWHCRKPFGFSMKAFVTADGHWDAFIIGSLIIHHLVEFLPVHLRGCDAATEAYRNRVHHVRVDLACTMCHLACTMCVLILRSAM